MKLLKYDNPIFNMLASAWDIMVLNIMWIIFSLPVITIGPATAAMYYCMLKINRKTDSSIVKMFLQSFHQNLKQGIILTIGFMIVGVLWYIDIQICRNMNHIIGDVVSVLLIILVVVWTVMVSYAFPLLAQFDTTIKNILINSFFMGIGKLHYTIVIVALNMIPTVLFWGFPIVFLSSIPIWITFGIALIAFMNTKMFVKIFEKYM